MTIKVYIYKHQETSPLVLLISTTNCNEDQEIYDKFYFNFYEILLSKDLIDERAILIFCNFKNGSMKKQLQIQGSMNSDQDIIKDLESNIKNVDYVVKKVLGEYSANYVLELDDKIKIKSTNVKLNIESKLRM